MKRISRFVGLGVVFALVMGGVAAAAFAPTTKFTLTPAKVNKFASVKVEVTQDGKAGDEELQLVTLRIPAGFNLPTDAALEGCTMAPGGRSCQGGDTLGTGMIDIAGGPGCATGVPEATKVAENLPAVLKERNRTDAESDGGVKGVWILEITGVTTIPLTITGSKAKGWMLDGEIVPNDATCPPLAFELTIDARSEDGKGLIRTPSKAGRYTFSATYEGTQGTRKTNRQTVKITR